MNSSGIKRGLAMTAISALAVTGVPFLASTASATPIAEQVGANSAVLYSALTGAVSQKNDGTNTTVSLVAGGGSNVTSIAFQYTTVSGGVANWQNIATVARNADGVFQTDWSSVPADLTAVRAVPNTGVGNADTAANVNGGTGVDTIELASEGNRGVFQSPYTEVGHDGDYVGVTGTVSQGTGSVTVTDQSDTGNSNAGTIETTADTASDTFNAVLDIDGYDYSADQSANQIAINGDTGDTDDAEGSTLYLQTIGSITADKATQEDVTPGDASVTLTVLDTTGKPVAGAQVYSGGDSAGTAPDTDTDGPETLVGYTNGRGQITVTPAAADDAPATNATTEKYYVNTTDNNAYEAGTDPATDVTVTTYTPALSTVTIKNLRNRTNFDGDEMQDTDGPGATSDDFVIETRDQRGNLYDEDGNAAQGDASDIEYRWTFDPAGTAPATVVNDWTDAVDRGDGTWGVLPPNTADTAEGTYTLEARRPNVNGSGFKAATPVSVAASNADITFDEGNSAVAPVNGDITIDGTLANDGGGLAGRQIVLDYSPDLGGDADFAPQSAQPAGVDVTPDSGGTGSTVTVTTGADGSFSVVLRDPSVPPNVTPSEEDGTLSADAFEAPSDTTDLNADNSIDVLWRSAREVGSIEISRSTDFWGANPGGLQQLDIVVKDADGNAYSDYPVTVTVTKGYLTDGEAADGHDDAGDEVGYWNDLGQTEDVSTGDNEQATIDTSIGRDTGFDDDGQVPTTVTVTAGGKTETLTFTWDSFDPVNGDALDIVPMAGEPQGQVIIGETVDHNVFAKDQFGNLVGSNGGFFTNVINVSDNTTDADFTTDFFGDQALPDFENSGASITAYGEAPTSQTISGAWNTSSNTYNANGGIVSDSKTVNGQAPTIEWVSPAAPEKVNAALTLRGNDNGAANDSLLANAIRKTAGSEVTLYRKKADGTWKKIRTGIMNAEGNYRFKNVNDLNGNGRTRYKAVVAPSEDTRRGVGKVTVR